MFFHFAWCGNIIKRDNLILSMIIAYLIWRFALSRKEIVTVMGAGMLLLVLGIFFYINQLRIDNQLSSNAVMVWMVVLILVAGISGWFLGVNWQKSKQEKRL